MAIQTELVRSKHGPTYKVIVSGTAGRIAVAGETLPVYTGIDDIHKGGFARSIIGRINRAEGGALPPGAKRKVEQAVKAALLEAEKRESNPRKTKRNLLR